jgi:1,4-alpha-glucan branching enzyme
VYLSGSFNNWSTMELPMQKHPRDGRPASPFPPGMHLYKYIVDGRWMTDPSNRLSEGRQRWNRNSVVYVYNHSFRLQGYENARQVVVSGSFNSWRERELQMKRVEGGWELPMFLREGTHAYKFVVDRRWITDPAIPLPVPMDAGMKTLSWQ